MSENQPADNMSPILKGLLTYGGTIALVGVTWGLTSQTVKQHGKDIDELKSSDKELQNRIEDASDKLATELKESNQRVTEGLMAVKDSIGEVKKDVAVMVERTKHLKE